MENAIDFISEKEVWNNFDKAAREKLNLSGEDFLKMYKTQKFGDLNMNDVMRVAILRPNE